MSRGAPPERIGKYAVLRKIASGGMAEVYLCRLTGEEGFEKKVAVKVVHPRLSADRHFRELFIREARTAAALVHPNLIQVFDFGKAGKSHYLAMEFIDGWNLAQAISQARLRATPVPLPVWRYWMEGILSGIGHLHSRGIVHRDISPSNVLLSRGGVVKITDFGIARGVLGKAGEKAGWEGKLAYMSPELAKGEEADAGSDLFAAAVISAEMLLLRRLLDAGAPEHILQRLGRYDSASLDLTGLPPAVAPVVRKGLSGYREDRYPDADEFSGAVRGAVPYAAGRPEVEACWDAIFPDGFGEDEDTVVATSPDGEGSGLLRESRRVYGKRRRRLPKIGAITALAAVSVGGWVVWKKTAPPASTPATQPSPPAVVSREVPPSPSAGHPAEAPKPVPLRSMRGPADPADTERSAGVPEKHSKTVLVETDPVGVLLSLEDGTPLGRTPVELDLAAWAGRKIDFRKEGFAGKSIEADVLVRFKTFRLEMERRMGTIEVIQAIPWAKVYDGDRYLGITPLHDLKLPVGPHRLRFVNEPLAVERARDIEVRAGHNPKVIVSLVEKKPSDP